MNQRMTIIVLSPGNEIDSYLKQSLSGSTFEIVGCHSSREFIERAGRAHMAIVDRINERPNTARLEIALLKNIDEDMPIIAISDNSTPRDAEVIKQGVFYYMAGYTEQKLGRVIQAAAEMISHSRNKSSKISNCTK